MSGYGNEKAIIWEGGKASRWKVQLGKKNPMKQKPIMVFLDTANHLLGESKSIHV
jgi:hypothetical protein